MVTALGYLLIFLLLTFDSGVKIISADGVRLLSIGRFLILSEILYVVQNVVSIGLFVIQIAMTIRAVLSWIPMDPNNFTELLYAITEPFIYPFRVLFQRLNWFTELPIDMSFMAAYLTLIILGIFL